MGAVAALDAGLPRTAITSLDLLALLRRDLENAVFDGKDATGSSLVIQGDRVLVTNTLRSDLALEVLAWLDDEGLEDGTPGMNETSLTGANFAQPENLLDLMTSNTSQLFGPEPVASFDIVGPAITISSPLAGAKLRGQVTINATASDPSDVVAIVAYIDARPSPAVGADQAAAPDVYQATLDTTQLTNGSHTLRVVALDDRENAALVDHAVVVDNQAPTVTATAASLVAAGSVTVNGTNGDTHTSVATLSFFVNDAATAAVTLASPPSSYSQAVPIPCNATSTVLVVATDAVGLTDEDEITVSCDNRPPAIDLGTSQYMPVDAIVRTFDPSQDDEWQYDSDGGGAVSLHLLDWSSAPGPLLKAYFNRLDYLPATFSTIAANDLPWFLFVPSDTSQAGTQVSTPAASLTVEYRYFYNEAPTPVRDWTALPYSATQGGFVLPVSYQTLGTQLAEATGTYLHHVEVRSRDAAGNTATRDLYFRLDADSPPVIYTDCSTGYLAGKGLEDDDLFDWFSIDNPSFFQGRLLFPRLPSGSLAPWRYTISAPAVSLSFEELERRQHKDTAPFSGCEGYTQPGTNWCTISYGSDAATGDSSCWPNSDDVPLRRWLDGPPSSTCTSGLWSSGPAPDIAYSLGTTTIVGASELLAAWDFDTGLQKWVMPENWLDSPSVQPVTVRVRAQETRPKLVFADAEVPTLPSPSVALGGGEYGFIVRTHTGYDLLRQCESEAAGGTECDWVNFHYARTVTVSEYIGSLQATVPLVPVNATVIGVGAVPVEQFGACLGDLVQTMEE